MKQCYEAIMHRNQKAALGVPSFLQHSALGTKGMNTCRSRYAVSAWSQKAVGREQTCPISDQLSALGEAVSYNGVQANYQAVTCLVSALYGIMRCNNYVQRFPAKALFPFSS